MKTAVLILLVGLLSVIPGKAQDEAALQFLKAEIQRTARQRDEARKKLLETESLSAEKVKILSQEQLVMQQRLNQTTKSLLELEASRRTESLANAKLAALEFSLGNLQQELANQYQQRSELEQEKEKLEAMVTDLQHNFEAMREKRDLLQANDEALRSKVGQLESQLAETAGDTRALSRQNEFLEKQLKEERKVRSRLEKDIADLRDTMQRAKAAGIQDSDLKDVALLVAGLEQEKEAFREEAMTHRQNVDLLQAELDRQNSAQQQQIREMQKMLVNQLDDMTAAQKKIQHLEARSATLDDVREQRAQLVAQQASTRADMRTLASYIHELRRELEIKKAQSDALEREKRALLLQLQPTDRKP